MSNSVISSKKLIIIYCDGGLANRINCLVNGRLLAEKMGLDYDVYWPVNRYCESTLGDVMVSSFIAKNKGKDDLKSLGSVGIVAEDNFIFAPRALWINPSVRGIQTSTLYRLDRLYEEVDTVIIFYPLPMYEFRLEFIETLSTVFRPQEEYIHLCNIEICKINLQQIFWGLHMRGTDIRRSKAYYNFFRLLARFLPGQVYLATDDADIVDLFSSSQSILLRKHAARVHKENNCFEWNSTFLDDNGDLLPYNVVRSHDSIRDAIIDLLLLSKSRLIPTSSSTYLELAANISNKKKSLVQLIFYSRYLFRVILFTFKYHFNKKNICN